MTTTLEGVSGQQHAPAILHPRERPGTHCPEGWGQGYSGWAENLAPPGFDPRTIQPVVSHHTELPGPQCHGDSSKISAMATKE